MHPDASCRTKRVMPPAAVAPESNGQPARLLLLTGIEAFPARSAPMKTLRTFATCVAMASLTAACSSSDPSSSQPGQSGHGEYDGFHAGSKADDPYGWSHVVLEASAGIGVGVDYVSKYHQDTVSYKPTNVDWAAPLYVNIWGSALTGNESVRVVLMNFEACQTVAPYTYIIDLGWYDDHFSGNVLEDAEIERGPVQYEPGTVQFTTRWSGYGGDRPFCQELAFVVDGTWFGDPAKGGNNFTFDMHAAK